VLALLYVLGLGRGMKEQLAGTAERCVLANAGQVVYRVLHYEGVLSD
jgi:hypothetical protein